VGIGVTVLLIDTHVVQWWSAEPERLSRRAVRAIEQADGLAVAAITWYELAWMAEHDRIILAVPTRSWLTGLAGDLRTLGVTPAVAATAVELSGTFPGDPADRLIYATAIEHGLRLVTKDRRLRDHPHPRSLTVW
jgi:PIN domain nuclease of toxin-antitoxin system